MSIFAPRNEPVGGILTAMNDAEKYVNDERYPETKLMNVWFAKSLAQRVGDSIVVNSIDPGWCPSSGLTDEVRKAGGIVIAVFGFLGWIFGRSMEMGVRSMAWGALKGEKNGAFSNNCLDERWVISSFFCWNNSKLIKITRFLCSGSPFAISKEGVEIQNRLWNEIVSVLVEFDPTLKQNTVVATQPHL